MARCNVVRGRIPMAMLRNEMPHPYEYAAATLFTPVDEILRGTGTPARTALMAVMGQVAYKLGCREQDPITWRPDHLGEKRGQDCLIEAWYIAKIRAKIKTGRISGDEAWRRRWEHNGRGGKICEGKNARRVTWGCRW